MPQTIAAVVVIALVFLVFARLSSSRTKRGGVDAQPDQVPLPRKPASRRQRKLEAYRAANPDPEIPSIIELMQQEAEETGVNEVPGGEGIQVPIKLRVWRRDALVREACTTGVRFEIAAGVEPSAATEDQVHLICLDPRLGDSPRDDSGN